MWLDRNGVIGVSFLAGIGLRVFEADQPFFRHVACQIGLVTLCIDALNLILE